MIFRCKRLKLSLSDPSIIIERGMLLGELYKAKNDYAREFHGIQKYDLLYQNYRTTIKNRIENENEKVYNDEMIAKLELYNCVTELENEINSSLLAKF